MARSKKNKTKINDEVSKSLTLACKKEEIKLLKLNGFKKIKKDIYSNGKCNIKINTPYEFNKYNYTIIDKQGNSMITENMNIYWLIGFLTYYRYIDRNYKTNF